MSITVIPDAGAPDFSPAGLAARAKALADHPEDWLHRVRLSLDGRWYERIHADADHEVWVISWLPGQGTGLHDHGGSRGAFAVALGALEEHNLTERGVAQRHAAADEHRNEAVQEGQDDPEEREQVAVAVRWVAAGEVRRFGPGHLHDVRNTSAGPAVSVHVYAPPLVSMRRYDLDEDGHVVEVATETEVNW
jgi:predicted metal-dependent enzyme (double-stranded beta helix superfamily)